MKVKIMILNAWIFWRCSSILLISAFWTLFFLF